MRPPRMPRWSWEGSRDRPLGVSSPPRPLTTDSGQQLAHLIRGHEPGFQPVRIADRLPTPVGFELVRVPGDPQIAAHGELEIGVELRLEDPATARLDAIIKGSSLAVAFLLADEPPRPARLFRP